MTKILAWHFAAADRRLAYGDGRAIVDGETLTHVGPVVLCKSGLHASTRIMDALRFAPGPVLCRVRLSGTVVRGGDKIAASSRETLWSIDATRALRLHAVNSAIVALERVGSPDPRSLAALREVLRQLADGAADGVASAAASAAAWAAAWAAASKRLRSLIGMERRGVLMPEINQVMARLDRLAKGRSE